MGVGIVVGIAGGIEVGCVAGIGRPGVASDSTLTVAISDSADPVVAGNALAYTVAVTVADIDAENVSVQVTLDANAAWSSGSGTGWSVSHSGGVVTATRATGAVGALPNITINCTTNNNAGSLSTSVVADASNASAVNDSETTAVVQYDGPGDWYVPKTAAEWTALGLTAPQHLYTFQEASGNIDDKIGSADMVPGGAGSVYPSYQQTISGWTRYGCSISPSTANQGFSVPSGQGPNLTSQSFAMLAFLQLADSDTTVNRHIMSFGNAEPDTDNVALYTPNAAGDTLRYRSENTTVVNSTYDIEPAAIAVMIVFNRNAGTSKVYYSSMVTGTPGEILTATYAGAIAADGYKTIGTVPVSLAAAYSADFDVMWSAMWSGAGAELTDANVVSIFQGLGVATRFNCPFDGPSPYINFPLTSAHFTAAQITEPASVWGMQEASGNLTADGGTAQFDLTAVTTPNLNQAVTGYTRKGVLYDNSAGDGHAAAAGTGPNPSSTSVLWYTVADLVTIGDGQTREMLTAGGAAAATQCSIQTVGAAGEATVRGKVVTNTGAGAVTTEAGTDMKPYFLLYDRTNSRACVYTLDEVIVVTYDSGVTDGQKGLAYMGYNNNPGFKACYTCVWSGASAELTDAQVHALMVAFGWTPAWSP